MFPACLRVLATGLVGPLGGLATQAHEGGRTVIG
jgi:hypothetical protein